MVRVRMDGYILPVVNELTCVISQELFVPIGKDFKDHTNWDVEDGGSLDEVILNIQSYGPPLSDIARRRHEMQWQNEFSKTYVRELTEARSRHFRGTSYFADGIGATSFMVGAGTLAVEHLPSWVAVGEVFMVLQLAMITGILGLQGAKAYRDARTKKHAGTLADHFSTSLVVTQGDADVSQKIVELHHYFESVEEGDDVITTDEINTAMANKAEDLGLPAVKKFYESRMDTKRVDGMGHKILSEGFLKSIGKGMKKWYKDDELNIVEQMGEKVGKIAERTSADIILPVSLLPSFDAYDVFAGHRDHTDLSDIASRVGENIDVNVTFEIYQPEQLSDSHRAELEGDLADAIHDNIYRMARIFNVVPKKAIETGSKIGRYMGIGGGLFALVGGISTIIAGSPVAGVAFGVGGAYLIARQFIFTKPLERANKLPYERLIKGQDGLQERLREARTFTYRIDPTLSAFDEIMTEHETPYLAYVACADAARKMNCPDIGAHYIEKALSVQPMDREARMGIMTLRGVKR